MSCTRIVTKEQKRKSVALLAKIKDLQKELAALQEKHKRLEEKGDYDTSSSSSSDNNVSRVSIKKVSDKDFKKMATSSPLKRTKATLFKRKREQTLPLSTGSKAKKVLLEKFLFESETGVSGEEDDDEYDSTGGSSSSEEEEEETRDFIEVDLTQDSDF